MSDEKLVKVLLHNRGEDVETPWAEDLGPADGGGRVVRLDNVPFLHAKPTFGDVIIVREDPDYEGALAWNRDAVAWERIGERLEQDGGRYAMIVDYVAEDVDRFGALSEWLGTHEVVPEGCFGPRDGKPGRLYLAVPKSRGVPDVMAMLATNDAGFEFIQIHPEPARAARAQTERPARAQTNPEAKAAPVKKAPPVERPAKKAAPTKVKPVGKKATPEKAAPKKAAPKKAKPAAKKPAAKKPAAKKPAAKKATATKAKAAPRKGRRR